METNRPLASNKDRNTETTEERKRKERELCALSSMGRNKGQARKNGNKKGKKRKIRHTPQRAAERNDAMWRALET